MDNPQSINCYIDNDFIRLGEFVGFPDFSGHPRPFPQQVVSAPSQRVSLRTQGKLHVFVPIIYMREPDSFFSRASR